MSTGWIIYFSIGFVLMGLLSWWGHNKLQGKPGQKKKERQDNAWPVQLVAGILMFVFPLPLLIFYIVYRILSSRLKDIPPACPQCGHTMELLPKEEGRKHMPAGLLFDEQIDSYQYEVWRCPECEEIEIVPINGRNYYKFDLCPQCGAHAMETVKREVVTKATLYTNGRQKNTRVCKCCGFTDSKMLILEQENYTNWGSSSSDDDWDDSSSSSSSRSGSSGSWGGGHSSGGGAGRRF